MFAGPLGRSTFTPPKSSFDSPLYGLVSLRRSQDDLASAQWTEERVHTMTWADGSVVVTHWKPSSVSGDGLRLDFIEPL